SLDQSRRRFPFRPRELPRLEGFVPARSHSRSHQRRAEQHHQDLLGGGRSVPATDAYCQHLRDELRPPPAATRSLQRFFLRPHADGGLDGRDLCVLQEEGLAVTSGPLGAAGWIGACACKVCMSSLETRFFIASNAASRMIRIESTAH